MTQINHRADVTILTPIFFRDAGGAAVYYQMLVSALSKQGYSVSVISDAEEGVFGGRYYRLLPKRSSRDKNALRDHLAYGIQNLLYPRLLWILRKEAPRTLLVHSSFYNFPGVFAPIINFARGLNRTTHFVADVRDRLIPGNKVRHLRKYNRVIACSENVRAHLESNGLKRAKVDLVPVLQQPIAIDTRKADSTVQSFGLVRNQYIFYVGAVKEGKGVDTLLKAYIEHIYPSHPGVSLVVVGLLKTESSDIAAMLKSAGVRYLSNLTRPTVLELMSAAMICVNLSPNEGMPRVSLEALALNKPTILPPNVPEFMRHCHDFVETSTDPKEVARRISDVMQSRKVPVYPIDQHFSEQLLPQYTRILGL
jgi:glycosyltransferase involved in cell wall biosynthesis